MIKPLASVDYVSAQIPVGLLRHSYFRRHFLLGLPDPSKRLVCLDQRLETRDDRLEIDGLVSPACEVKGWDTGGEVLCYVCTKIVVKRLHRRYAIRLGQPRSDQKCHLARTHWESFFGSSVLPSRIERTYWRV